MLRQTQKEQFVEVYDRLCLVLKAKTQAEVAKSLGIRQSTVSRAVQMKLIPDSWLLKILKNFRINPEWLLHGDSEKKYLIGSNDVC